MECSGGGIVVVVEVEVVRGMYLSRRWRRRDSRTKVGGGGSSMVEIGCLSGGVGIITVGVCAGRERVLGNRFLELSPRREEKHIIYLCTNQTSSPRSKVSVDEVDT